MAGTALFLLLCALPPGADDDRDGITFFETKVRPILAERCDGCHSARAKRVRGGLLLDSKAAWTRGGESGPVINPGDPEGSLLVRAIRYDDPDLKMPPKGRLPDTEIAALVEWVKRGAPDPRTTAPAAAPKPRTIDLARGRQHWAFRPLARAEPPPVAQSSWCRNPVDRFILAKLEANGLAPSLTAPTGTLLRRAYFDLIGLPPNPAALQRFVNDNSPDAFERVIDGLLAEPRHGERWARHWLDLARFAESHGFEHDTDRPSAYHYRDFVVEALNRDLPYDTFIRWQIAGDELEPGNPLALKATGFLAAGVHSTQITANQVEKERYDELDDMAGTIGTAFLGLTIGCARCHDHKFDPIPQQDYYRLLASFTKSVRSEIDIDLDPDGFQRAQSRFDQEHAPYIEALARHEATELPARLAAWEEKRVRCDEPSWIVLEPLRLESQGGATLRAHADGTVEASGPNPYLDTFSVVCATDARAITAVQLIALDDPRLPESGPGRGVGGDFVLSDFRLTAAPKSGGEPVPVRLRSAKASFEEGGWSAAAAIDGDKTSGWGIAPQVGKTHHVLFETEADVGFECGTTLQFTLEFRARNNHNLGRFRLAATTMPRPPADGPSMPEAAVRALATLRERRTPEQCRALLAWYATTDPEWQTLSLAARDHARKAPRPSLSRCMITTEGLPAVRLNTQGADFFDKTYFLKRGDPNQKLAEATQGFLRVLTSDSQGSGCWRREPPAGSRTTFVRAALADWLTDVDRGAGSLLARVIANRLWQHHFGRGLVATPSDFGSQGELPSHPELLDWLAGELIRGGWRLKPIHRLIVMSAAYRQASRFDPASARVDPDNRLCDRQARRRLEAEPIRDAMLAAAGILDGSMYGPGSLDLAQRRRSIYFTVKRSRLIPMLVLFDGPDALQGLGMRASTTVAPQALLLMNNPDVRDWAGAFARRVLPTPDTTPEAAIVAAYRIALSRPPAADELDSARRFVAMQADLYRTEAGDDATRRAITDFCQVLFGLSEFVFVQ
jgi:hypothetical protein